MRKVSDTIVRLAAWRAQQSSHLSDFIGPDRLSTLGEFGSNPGALRSRFYLPELLPDGAPLVVVLHGCTQNAAGYDYRAAGRSSLSRPVLQCCIRSNSAQTIEPLLQLDSSRGYQPRLREALSIRQMIETFVSAHNLDRKRVFITGLSAGGALAAVMLATYPDVFAAGAIIAGLPVF